MREIILFDTVENFENLLPISFTRPISHLRVGITTLIEKWQAMLPGVYGVKTVPFLADVFPCAVNEKSDTLYIASNILPEEKLIKKICSLKPGEALTTKDATLIAFFGNRKDFENRNFSRQTEIEEVDLINYVFDIFLLNNKALTADYVRLTTGRKSQPLSESNLIIGSFINKEGLPMVFMEEGAKCEGATLNLKEGPIYIGRNAEIMEGTCVRGPLALCEGSKLKMGAKVYGATTLGPYCKAGGELNNVVMLGYSNKAHDGFLGNAVIGEWCNIGAGVNASNLKNDYSKIRVWNYRKRTFMRTDLQFCGLIMGDHSKAGVNCMFNTATVLGVGVNVHGSGFPRVFVPSFSEGSPAGGFSDVSLKKFFDIAERVMSRRDKKIGEKEQKIFEHVYTVAQSHKSPQR